MKSAKQLFPGIEIYVDEKVTIRNPFSGEAIDLTGEEASVYDVIMGAQMVGRWGDVRKGLDWFRQKNPEAYYVLLD